MPQSLLLGFNTLSPGSKSNIIYLTYIRNKYKYQRMSKLLNSLGFDKKPSETTVVVAMSGGVDSSTVAGMMRNEGYKVIGITLKLYDDGKEVAASKQCCSGQDIMDAKRVANKLDYLRFPLGNLLKDKTREIAKNLDLNVADKPDSQDICFVPNGDYASVIQKFRPDSFKKGNIKNLEGKVIGVHEGIINFTIGQRKGIKVSDKEALYVLKINSENNEIIVGPKEYLGKTKINLKDINLLTDKDDFKKNIYCKVRSTGKLLEANVNFSDDNKAEVNLAIPEDGISPGQACVFYNKDQFGYKVLGGGWIKE